MDFILEKLKIKKLSFNRLNLEQIVIILAKSPPPFCPTNTLFFYLDWRICLFSVLYHIKLSKLIKFHQYLGVNNLCEKFGVLVIFQGIGQNIYTPDLERKNKLPHFKPNQSKNPIRLKLNLWKRNYVHKMYIFWPYIEKKHTSFQKTKIFAKNHTFFIEQPGRVYYF